MGKRIGRSGRVRSRCESPASQAKDVGSGSRRPSARLHRSRAALHGYRAGRASLHERLACWGAGRGDGTILQAGDSLEGGQLDSGTGHCVLGGQKFKVWRGVVSSARLLGVWGLFLGLVRRGKRARHWVDVAWLVWERRFVLSVSDDVCCFCVRMRVCLVSCSLQTTDL